jgi:hypothetical protein
VRIPSVISVGLAALACCAATSAAATPPGVKTGGTTAITPQTATIKGSINPHGAPTAFYFQFGRTTAYGTRTTTGDAGAGTRTIAASAPLTALKPKTTYHYRLVAFSTAGTTRGADRTFKTLQIPTALALTASPNPVVYGGVISVAGALTGPDISGKQVALQGKPYPYTGSFQQIGNSVLTSAQGGYSFLFPIGTTMQLRVLDQSKPSIVSPTITENVALSATLHARRSHRHKGRVRFTGRVTPPRIGNAVLIQRRKHKRWKTVRIGLTRARTAAYSVFSRRLHLHRGGKFRAVVRTTGGDYVDGVTRTVRVRRPRR